MSTRKPSRSVVYLALIAIQILFGINYAVSKIVVEAVPPLVWASARIIISSILMLGVALAFRRQHHPKTGKAFFLPLVIFALLGTVINQGSFLVGLHHTTATNSAILNTLIPVFTLLIVTLRGQEALTLKRAIGFILSFGGVLVLRRVEDLTLSNQTLIGDLLTILNCLSYGLFLSYSKSFLERNDRVWTTTWLFIYGSIGLSLIAAPDWLHFQMPQVTLQLAAAMVFAIVGGTLLTYFLNIWTLAHAKSTSVAIFIYLQPVIASTLAWLWFGEVVTARTAFSSLMIFAGVLLALSPASKAKRANPVAVATTGSSARSSG